MKIEKKETQNIDAIVRHINKLQGQLESVKKELTSTQPECDVATNTLYAASRSFASLRMLFVTCFLQKEFLKQSSENKKLEHLLTLIKG